MTEPNEREVVQHEPATGQPAATVTPPPRIYHSHERIYSYRVIQAIWWIVGLVDVLIAIRFLLKLFGASTASTFVRFMYDITAALVAPFHGIFNTAAEGRSILEPESLVAMAIYTLIGWGIVSLIIVVGPRSSRTTIVD